MRRRSLLAVTGIGLAGCARLTPPPEVRLDSGHARLHPASERVLTVERDGEWYATAVPDEAPDVVGPDAPPAVVDTLTNPGREDQFHVVTQLRSTPDQPLKLSPDITSTLDWTDRSTLRVRVEISPWGDLDRLDDADAYRTADSLLYTGVWTVTGTTTPPENVTLQRVE